MMQIFFHNSNQYFLKYVNTNQMRANAVDTHPIVNSHVLDKGNPFQTPGHHCNGYIQMLEMEAL